MTVPGHTGSPPGAGSAKTFLTAEWLYLAMLNYRVPASLLQPYVPAGTVLDSWNGHSYLSIIGFLFRDTRVFGIPIPWHRNFEELNLRLYVRREVNGETRRGVTFISELVPRRAIATVARLAYNEPYSTLPMHHRVVLPDPNAGTPGLVEYGWGADDGGGRLAVAPHGMAQAILERSEEEFITAKHWGYTRQRDGGTIEYRVDHPRWRIWQVRDVTLAGNLESLYGSTLAEVLATPPDSAFLADGSPVAVSMPRRLPAEPTPGGKSRFSEA